MFFKTSVAAYYIHGSNFSIRDLAEKAGITQITELDNEEMKGFGKQFSSERILYGHWGAFGDTWVKVDSNQDITCLQLYFSMNSFFDHVNVNDDNSITELDNSSPMKTTFTSACQEIQPLIAFVDIKSHFENDNWEINLGNSDQVVNYIQFMHDDNIAVLFRENFWLMYLSNSMVLESQVSKYYEVENIDSGKVLISK